MLVRINCSKGCDRGAGKARDAFLKALDLGMDPILDARSSETPVGLKVRLSNLYQCIGREFMFRM
jgi:hypothetical protein